MLGDPGEHLIGSFDDDPTLSHEITSAEHRERIVRERRRHIGTVRSAAGSRNQPHRRIAWLLLVLLIVLAALVARLDAAPSTASARVARQYADALTGADRDEPARAGPRGWPSDEDPADRPTGDAARAAPAGDVGAQDARDRRTDDRHDGDEDDTDDDTDRRHRGAEQSEVGRSGGDLDAVTRLAGLAGHSAMSAMSADVTAGVASDPDDGNAADASGSAAGELAVRDAERSPPDAALGNDASAASAQAGAAEMYEAWMRRVRPSWWGRLDFGVAWRQRWSVPRYAPPTLHHELWLVATWRR